MGRMLNSLNTSKDRGCTKIVCFHYSPAGVWKSSIAAQQVSPTNETITCRTICAQGALFHNAHYSLTWTFLQWDLSKHLIISWKAFVLLRTPIQGFQRNLHFPYSLAIFRLIYVLHFRKNRSENGGKTEKNELCNLVVSFISIKSSPVTWFGRHDICGLKINITDF